MNSVEMVNFNLFFISILLLLLLLSLLFQIFYAIRKVSHACLSPYNLISKTQNYSYAFYYLCRTNVLLRGPLSLLSGYRAPNPRG
jgi:hypothetical protein